jgi:hypothetical protein
LFLLNVILGLYKVDTVHKGKLQLLSIVNTLRFKLLIFTVLCLFTGLIEKQLSLTELVSSNSTFFLGVIIYLTVVSMGVINRKHEVLNFKDKNDLLYNIVIKYLIVPSKALIIFSNSDTIQYINNYLFLFILIGIAAYYLSVFILSSDKEYIALKLLEFFAIWILSVIFTSSSEFSNFYYASFLAGSIPLVAYIFFHDRSFFYKKLFFFIFILSAFYLPISPSAVLLTKVIFNEPNKVISLIHMVSLIAPMIAGLKLIDRKVLVTEMKNVNNLKIDDICLYVLLSIVIMQLYALLIYEQI